MTIKESNKWVMLRIMNGEIQFKTESKEEHKDFNYLFKDFEINTWKKRES